MALFRPSFYVRISYLLDQMCLRAARTAAIALFCAAAFPGSQALAFSNRCADAENVQASQPAEISRITVIWKSLHGPGLDGGDGPLGCPIGAIQELSDAGYDFKGVGQQYQRGWIFIGRQGYAGHELAVVRGLDSWTVWATSESEQSLIGAESLPTGSTPAAQPFSGMVMTYKKSNTISLFRCPNTNTVLLTLFGCVKVIPTLNVSPRPFDFAARLNLDLLAAPNRSARMIRTDAAISDWLPCFTQNPNTDESADEDTIAHASIMLRRETPCPLTNVVPRDTVKSWLETLELPEGEVPGSTYGDKSFLGGECPERKGELDVLLVQLVGLRFKYATVLQGPAAARIEDAIAPWGGSPRFWPYITPGGFCFGRAIIETENHLLLQETARYFVNLVKSKPNQANRDWLIKFMQQLVRRDFYEFNALPYTRYDIKALFVLADYAPDDAVKVAAKGVLDGVFTKLALSGNMDRDHRPYRRRPDAGILSEKTWWGSSKSAAGVAASIFVGPVQHASEDLDLQLDRESGNKAMLNIGLYPNLGTATEYNAAALVDAVNTNYTVPEALAGWFEKRFVDDASNRLTYVQGIRHHSATADDANLFLQENSGSEIVSGNRNWTIVGGGSYAKPGYLPTPPRVGGLAGALSDTYAEKTQLDKLWDDQPGIMRETMLIPSPVGLSRQQTLRFGGSEVSPRDRNGLGNRLCVAEGFMCGFDLRMPDKPFPSSEAVDCPPIKSPLPPALVSEFEKYAGTGPSVTERLGCLLKSPGIVSPHNWMIWTFEHGMLALPLSATPDAFMGAWIESRQAGRGGRLRVVWNSSWNADWFRVHAYARNIVPRNGEPPGGWVEPLPISGDAGDRTKDNKGDVSFDLNNVNSAATWDLLIVGCQKEYFLGVNTGHDCQDSVLPKLTVSVGPEPAQSFSCKVHNPPPRPTLGLPVPPSEGIVLEVGSCADSPYGLFVYYWTGDCPRSAGVSKSDPENIQCPFGVPDYGFVVVAPSRGLSADDFRAKVEASMFHWRQAGNDYRPKGPASIDVPISPPVIRTADGWKPDGFSSQHTVTFEWTPLDSGSVVTGDTGAPGLFGAGSLTVDPDQWPTALGHVSAPDVAGANPSLLASSGTGCFTVAGLPTPSDPDPIGLLVDLRNAAAPIVSEPRTSDLAARCP